MAKGIDEEIIYQAYIKASEQFFERMGKKPNSKLSTKRANEQIKIVRDNASKLEYYLGENDVTMTNMQKKMQSTKGTYVQFLQVKGSCPGLITRPIENQMDRVLRLLAKREAELFDLFRRQEECGELYDLEAIFSNKANVNSLISLNVRDIVKNKPEVEKKINKSTEVGHVSDQYFISNTGSKYHVEDCPFCKRYKLHKANKQKILGLKLKPCKCVESYRAKKKDDWDNYVTVFIDESIHPTLWNEAGDQGKQGNYSYIICRGKLESEREISQANTITQGVNIISEIHSTDRLTKAAIGTVLMYLAYDYEFTGAVQIYTDNMSAMQQWNENPKNARLASLFKGVRVSHIMRENNTKADALGHTRVVIDVPTQTYSRIAKRCNEYDALEKESTEKDELIKNYRESLEEALRRERQLENRTLWDYMKSFFAGRRNIEKSEGKTEWAI